MQITQKSDYTSDDDVTPDVFNQIGNNIKAMAKNIDEMGKNIGKISESVDEMEKNITIITMGTEEVTKLPEGHIHIVYEIPTTVEEDE